MAKTNVVLKVGSLDTTGDFDVSGGLYLLG
jgi:hypothetical protein